MRTKSLCLRLYFIRERFRINYIFAQIVLINSLIYLKKANNTLPTKNLDFVNKKYNYTQSYMNKSLKFSGFY